MAETNSGSGHVTIDSGVTVSGGGVGIIAETQTGSQTVINNGTVLGSAGAAAYSSMAGTGSSLFINNGVLRGATAAINGGGDMTVLNNVALDGRVTTTAGATTEAINVGTWTKAGGSTVTTLSNYGTLSLGPAGGAPATLAVSGDATFANTTHWTARLGATGVDMIAVGGKTTISGGTLAVAITPGVYAIGAPLQVLTSTGGITGAFDHAYISGGTFASKFVETANGLSLMLGYGLIAPIAVTAKEKAVANALDAATRTPPTGAAGKLMSAIYSQSGAAPLATLDQMNGDAPGGAINANLAAGRMFAEAIGARQDVLRSEVGSTASGRSTRAMAGGGSVGVWTAGFGSVDAFAADRKQGFDAVNETAMGAILGVDYQYEGLSFGVAGGVSEGAFRAGAATGTARGLHAGLHADINSGGFYAAASLSGARYTDDTSRLATAPAGLGAETDTGRFTAIETRARLETGWRDTSAGFHVAPFAAVETAVVTTNAYAETVGASGGAGMMSMNYEKSSTPSAPGFVGLRMDDNVALAGGAVISVKASVALEHEFAAARDLTASLAVLPGSSFAVAGARTTANALKVELGVEAHLSAAVALFASLEGAFSTTYRSLAGRGGATLRW